MWDQDNSLKLKRNALLFSSLQGVDEKVGVTEAKNERG